MMPKDCARLYSKQSRRGCQTERANPGPSPGQPYWSASQQVVVVVSRSSQSQAPTTRLDVEPPVPTSSNSRKSGERHTTAMRDECAHTRTHTHKQMWPLTTMMVVVLAAAVMVVVAARAWRLALVATHGNVVTLPKPIHTGGRMVNMQRRRHSRRRRIFYARALRWRCR